MRTFRIDTILNERIMGYIVVCIENDVEMAAYFASSSLTSTDIAVHWMDGNFIEHENILEKSHEKG